MLYLCVFMHFLSVNRFRFARKCSRFPIHAPVKEATGMV